MSTLLNESVSTSISQVSGQSVSWPVVTQSVSQLVSQSDCYQLVNPLFYLADTPSVSPLDIHSVSQVGMHQSENHAFTQFFMLSVCQSVIVSSDH